jgi:alkylhydroperoxidase family enzyme
MKPLPISAWNPSLQHVVDDMHGRPLNIHALMANHPGLLNAWWRLRMYLVNGGDLTQRHCELVILRVAVHMKSWYEWASHVVRGIDSGLTVDEIQRVRSGEGEWGDADGALLRAVDDVTANNCISEATRTHLQKHFTNQQMLDIVLLYGMYQTLACLVNTWGMELDEHVQEQLPEVFAESAFSE